MIGVAAAIAPMMAQLSKVLFMSLAFRGLSGVIQFVIAVTAAARTNQVFHAVLIGRALFSIAVPVLVLAAAALHVDVFHFQSPLFGG